MKRAHSSATLFCEPLGEIGIVVVLPPAAANAAVAAVISELLSCAAPLLMYMMKFFAQPDAIGVL
ncbi:hypothetical protein D9M69_355920 [compost metagenome]